MPELATTAFELPYLQKVAAWLNIQVGYSADQMQVLGKWTVLIIMSGIAYTSPL